MKRKLIKKFIFLLIILLMIHSLPSYAIDKIRFSNKESPLKTASLPPRIVEDTIIVKFKTPVTSQIIEKLNKHRERISLTASLRIEDGITDLFLR